MTSEKKAEMIAEIIKILRAEGIDYFKAREMAEEIISVVEHHE